MKKLIVVIIGLITIVTLRGAEPSFTIRGVLPWHNFLSGPSAWNRQDYEHYLDECVDNNINFIGFHNYTGGAERYSNYVEPMIKIKYRGVIPDAYFDNSSSARWGYLPMSVSEFHHSVRPLFKRYKSANIFGADCSVQSKTKLEHYDNSQKLMRQVLDMAHKRDIRMAIGFEFGVFPPDYFSLTRSCEQFFWPGEANMVPNPTSQLAIEIHYATLDNILETYPTIDYIWLWLNEHCFMGVDVMRAISDPNFGRVYNRYKSCFDDAPSDKERFIGVWAAEYIRLTHDYLKQRGSNAKLILGGWGGGNQLPSILSGLDRAVPKDIVFSCLNPNLGRESQPLFLSGIAKNRDVWAMPWLEGDHQLWHFQPRIEMIKRDVSLASKQDLQGVVAIHWRTDETRFNMKAFSMFANNVADTVLSVESLYLDFFEKEFGIQAAKELSPIIARMDIEQTHDNVESAEYFGYSPHWGVLDDKNLNLRLSVVEKIKKLTVYVSDVQRARLEDFCAMFEFEYLLHYVQKAMAPAFNMKREEVVYAKTYTTKEYAKVLTLLRQAPVDQMFAAYAKRTDTRGELGVLSSINQRVWGEYLRLEAYLKSKL